MTRPTGRGSGPGGWRADAIARRQRRNDDALAAALVRLLTGIRDTVTTSTS